MRVVQISDGLGNQLFGYAFYRKVQKLYGNCYVDLGWFDKKDRLAWYPYQLELLGLKSEKKGRDEYCVKEYYMQNHQIGENEFKNIALNMKIPILHLFHEKNPYSCDRLWENDDAYYAGRFQNIDNFLEAINDIKKEIVFPEQQELNYNLMKEKIKKDNSVSLHVRLNDYSEIEDFEKVCPISYYIKAIKYLLEKNTNLHFYVFSNRMEEVRKRLPVIANYTYVEINDRFHGIGDLELMSLCKHNIIPNSTFSWWAAVLNKNMNKIIVAPNQYNIRVEGVKNEDINLWFDDWIRLS